MENKENLKVEFKSEQKAPISDDELLDEIVGMANAEGGTIYLGVEDDGKPTGASARHQDIDGLRAMVMNKTLPSVFVDAQLKKEAGFTLVSISVPVAGQIVATRRGKIVQRRVKADGTPEIVPFYPWEFSARQSYFSEFDLSAQVVPSLVLGDLDRNSISSLKEEIAKSTLSDKTLSGLGEEELLSVLGLTRMDGEKNAITYAGLLLLGSEDALKKFAPGNHFSYQILKNGKVQKNEEFQENIVQAFRRFETFVASFNFEDELLIGMRRVGIPYFDPEGLREAFANAVAHRDYTKLDGIRVLVDDLGVTISNPGSLIHGLSKERLLSTEPRGRNPALSTALKRCGYCEKTGRGVDKIYVGQARYGKSWPDYSGSDDGSVVLFIPKSTLDEPFARKILEQQNNLPLFSLLVLSSLRQERVSSKEELMNHLGMTQGRLESALIPLQERNLVSPADDVGPWEVSPSFLNDRNRKELTTEALLEKALGVASENGGELTNADLQDKLGVDSTKAYNLIKKLCERKKLKLVQSGKYAKYKMI